MKSISLSNSIRRGSASIDLNDVLDMKKALNIVRYYDTPEYGITEFPDERMFSAIEKFQKDRKIKVDGIVNPKGETEKAINEELKVSARSPIVRCTVCGGPHGGSKGDLCPQCDSKM